MKTFVRLLVKKNLNGKYEQIFFLAIFTTIYVASQLNNGGRYLYKKKIVFFLLNLRLDNYASS